MPNPKYPEQDGDAHKFMISVKDPIFQSLEEDAKDRGVSVQDRVRQILADTYLPATRKK